jgi:uncharacterized protein (DUF2147 family)
MAYAYRDKYGILHVTSSPVDKYKCVKVDVPCTGGFPYFTEEGKKVKVFDEGEAGIFIYGNSTTGKKVSKNDYRVSFLQPVWKELGE